MYIYRLFWLALLAVSAHTKSSARASAASSSRKLRASARADSWSWSGNLPSWFQAPSAFTPPASSAQGAAEATVDSGIAGSNSQSTTTTPEFYLDCICLTPNADTTAEVLSEAFAAGVNSAESRAAAKAVSMAGDKCCIKLGQALAKAAAYAESQGQGNAFVTAASRSEAEATNMCGRMALAQAVSGARAANANSEAVATATASGSRAESQTETTVGQGYSSSSSSSWASSGRKQ